MTNTPRSCPNLGVDCEYPDCTFLEADCATANAPRLCICADPENCTERVPGYVCRRDVGALPTVRVVPPTKPGDMPTLFPITAKDIFKE